MPFGTARRAPFLLAPLLLSAPAAAQTRQDEQAWVNVTAAGSAGRLLYFAEVQPRVGEGLTEVAQLLLRPAVGLRLTPRLSVYQGYARVLSPDGPDRREHRSFQQLGWTATGPGAPVEVQLRTRLEQRWIDGSGDAGHRLRQLVRVEVPLSRAERAAGLLVHAEPFVALNTTAWGARRGLDQVRAFGGVELPFDRRSTVELGYLAQVVNQPAGATRWNHVASATFFFRP